MLAEAVRYVITSRHTTLLGAARPEQMPKSISTDVCTERQPVEHFQPVHGHPFVIIGCNSRLARRFLEALGTVDIGESCLQNPQYDPLRDDLRMLSPLSLPQMSGKSP
jgi:hypothetical protein